MPHEHDDAADDVTKHAIHLNIGPLDSPADRDAGTKQPGELHLALGQRPIDGDDASEGDGERGSDR